MTPKIKVVGIVCIAICVFAAVAAVPMFAVLDAQTPIDALFWSPAETPAPIVEDPALPAAPAVRVRSLRAPPDQLT